MRKYVFVSNYLTHHQIPFCEAMTTLSDVEFYFIQTIPMEDDRIALGWNTETSNCLYFVNASGEDCRTIVQKYCFDADVVIVGDTQIDMNTLVFKESVLLLLYRERLFKKSWMQRYNPITIRRLKASYKYCTVYKTALLCAGAYVASDFKKIVDFSAGTWKWGYFPKTIEYDKNKVIAEKAKNEVVKILWVGRYIDWKRTIDVIRLANCLKNNGIPFQLDIVGNGVLKDKLLKKIRKSKLENSVFLHDSKTPDQIRELMLGSNIYILTSNRNEGWGAVVNEAMNSLCVVVATKEAGAVPYLIKDKKNGFIYSSGKINELYAIVKDLIQNRDKMDSVSHSAYHSIVNEWNAKVAAERLQILADQLLIEKHNVLFESGVCSTAKS